MQTPLLHLSFLPPTAVPPGSCVVSWTFPRLLGTNSLVWAALGAHTLSRWLGPCLQGDTQADEDQWERGQGGNKPLSSLLPCCQLLHEGLWQVLEGVCCFGEAHKDRCSRAVCSLPFSPLFWDMRSLVSPCWRAGRILDLCPAQVLGLCGSCCSLQHLVALVLAFVWQSLVLHPRAVVA